MKNKDPLDVHVGSRVKMQRMLRRITQEQLAAALGLSFQQVQKYEKGMSRIGAARLQIIARTLGVPVTFFFEGAPASSMPLIGEVGVPAPDASFVHRMAAMPDGLQLARAFTSIEDARLRRRIVDLVESMLEMHQAAARKA
jgi:transcriptional regulator with XRE-family HTH domain